MINVQQITSQLARLPDQALQQYAQMHKNDPYIMALALSESNRRKQMREGAQMAAPEQPKVVDQEIANMAAPMPEDVGIAQLPAGEMEFADGGIVAFDEGGSVEWYQSQGLVQPPAGERLYRSQDGQYFARPLTGQTGYEGMGPGEFFSTIYTQALRKLGLSDKNFSLTPAEQRAVQAEANKIAATQGVDFENKYGPATPTTVTDPRFRSAGAPAAAVAAPTEKPAPTGAAPNVDTTGAAGGARPPRPAAPAAPAAAAAAVPAAGLPSLDVGKMTKDALEAAAKAPNPFAKDIEALGKERVKAKEEEAAGVEAIQKRFDDIFKGRKERLDTREAELGKMKDQGIGLALLQAGAAMMSTPGGLGVALGKGVKVGTEQYASGLERLRSAQEKLSDARDRLEETEAQRGEMSARELLKARTEVKNAGISAREEMIKSNMQMYGVNRDTAMKMVDNQIQVGIAQFREAEATKRTGMEIEGRMRAAAMLPQEMRGAMLLGTGNTDAERLRTGLSALMEVKDRMTDTKIAELYTKHVADAKKELQTPMTPEDFAKTIRSAMSAYRPTVANVENTRPR